MEFDTVCIHGNLTRNDQMGSVSMPIYQTATFSHPAVGESTGYDYSRTQNPTREQLEKTIARLENGTEALAFSSGMAAIAALMELFQPGDHIIASDDLYGGTYRLFEHISLKNGLQIDFVDTSAPENIELSLKENTVAFFIETPTNPLMQITDIRAVSTMAQKSKALLVVDNTFLTPYLQRPLTIGADIVVHSGTKYLSGHNDTLAGFLVTDDNLIAEKLRLIMKTTGACLAPFDSWLVLRGIKTLAVRLDRQQASAMKIAGFLQSSELVKEVYFPGIQSHPGYKTTMNQASGFGAMISFTVEHEQIARRVLNHVTIIQYAESLGGVESLITYPILQTHADMPADILEAKGINRSLLRLSVGLENADDLISDLEKALEDHTQT